MSEKLLEGIAPALLTPFKADGSGIDTDAVAAVVEMHINAGMAAFYLCGSTGEGLHMNIDERKAMTEAAIKAVQRRVPVIVQVGAASLSEAVDLAAHAEAAGADAISSVVPPSHPNNLGAAVEYWKAISEASSLPFYAYWVAQTADVSVTPQEFLSRMSIIKTFRGIKFTDKNFYMFQQIMAHATTPLNAITGPDEMMVAGLAMGSDGAIGSTYNVHPKLAASIYKAFHKGDVKTATKLQVQMNKVITILLDDCLARGAHIVDTIKVVMRRIHGIDVGIARLRGRPMTQAEEDELVAKIKALDFKLE